MFAPFATSAQSPPATVRSVVVPAGTEFTVLTANAPAKAVEDSRIGTARAAGDSPRSGAYWASATPLNRVRQQHQKQEQKREQR